MKKHIITNGFSKKFEQQVYQCWAETTGYLTNAEKHILKNYFDSTSKTIEAGTGGGRISFYLEKEMNFKDIVAFDLLPQLVERCKQRGKERNSKVKFILADVSSLNGFNKNTFDNILYTGQVLSMVPKKKIRDSLKEALKIGHKSSTYLFTFMNWESRWYNAILSFVINLIRVLKFQKIQFYYLPEVRHMNRLNKDFFNKKGHSILWIKKKHAKKMIEEAGFNIKSFYCENHFSEDNGGSAIFFICSK